MAGIAFMIGGPKRDKYGDHGDEDDGHGHDHEEGMRREGGDDLMARARKRAAEDIIAAVKDGDAKALDKALEAHYEACEDEEEDEPEEGE